MCEERGEVSGEHLRRIIRHLSFEQIAGHDYNAVIGDNLLEELRAFHVSACGDCHIHYDSAGLHTVENVLSYKARSLASEHLRGRDDYIGALTDFRLSLLLLCELFGCKLLRVTLIGLTHFSEVDLHEARAEGFYLILNDRSCVESVNSRAETLCGSYRLESRNAYADNERASRVYRT